MRLNTATEERGRIRQDPVQHISSWQYAFSYNRWSNKQLALSWFTKIFIPNIKPSIEGIVVRSLHCGPKVFTFCSTAGVSEVRRMPADAYYTSPQVCILEGLRDSRPGGQKHL